MMNKNEFVRYIAERNDLTIKDSEAMVNTVIDGIQSSLVSGNSLKFVGFATFEIVEKAEREGRNPSTGEKIIIPKRKVIKFKPSKLFKDAIDA